VLEKYSEPYKNTAVIKFKLGKKTKLMYLNTDRLAVIFEEGKQLDTVDSFNYLRSCITTEGGDERDIKISIHQMRQYLKDSSLFKEDQA
jgi:hypothetical protein